ncbi:hypothetical protein CCR75_004645 [Bremia lactucae]|uniref:SCP domain-containing protein n=1 Tax=Bremia lactucae TaxID=4779 RepID=A0A976FR70_BRELC|nr:hypothetical protein CCR75_004645 [Bremia lactucae]
MFVLQQSTLALLLSFASVSSATNLQQMAPDFSPVVSSQPSDLVAHVNMERANHGLANLCTNHKLQAAAERHIMDQFKTDFMSDTGTDNSHPEQRITDAGFEWQSVAESVDAGDANATDVLNWWMKGENRENVLGKYTMVGTAYVYNEMTFNKHYWVQVYATSSSEHCDS